jgi:hypothetical protein
MNGTGTRKERKGNFGGGKVAFVKAPEIRVGYLRGQPYARPFYYAPIHFSLGYVVCLLAVLLAGPKRIGGARKEATQIAFRGMSP